MAKLRIEVSCTEDKIRDAVSETLLILNALNILYLELRVFHDINRQESMGHTWINVNKDSRLDDVIKIYELEKKLKNLEGTPKQ